MGLKNVFIGICVLILLFLFIPIPIDKYTFENPEQQFINFMQQYNKSYSNETVYQKHYRAFLNSMKVINDLNAKRKHNHSAYYGLTKFSDMTPDEFLDEHLQSDLYQRISERGLDDSNEYDKNDHHKIHPRSLKLSQLPEKVDWRKKGVVTQVNNQKLCGACWAFSVTQNMESMFAIKYGKLRQLSVQQLIDCAGYNNDGCAGGDSCNLLHWLKDYNITVYNEEDYPLQWQTQKCKKVVNKEGVQINKFACQRLVGNENYILATLANVGPVAVAINALTWQYYLGGVIQFHCGSSFKLLNHAVQIVGYDLTAEIPHYIVRNSWGKDFGKNGYLYIAIGENLCGLANEVSVLSIL